METFSSRDFNQKVSQAKRAAETQPVLITDRGVPSHVLLSYDAYLDLTLAKGNIVDLLAMPEADAIEFEPERLPSAEPRIPDLS